MVRQISKTERAALYEVVAQLDRRGYTQTEIAAKAGISQQAVSKYLGQLDKVYQNTVLRDHPALIAEKIQQIRELRKEAFEAYERSKKDIEKTVTEEALRAVEEEGSGDDSGDRPENDDPSAAARRRLGLPILPSKVMQVVKVTTTREGRLPLNAYLQTIKDLYEMECDLLGLNAPQRHDIRTVAINWDVISSELQAPRPVDTIEQKINSMLEESMRPAVELPIQETLASSENEVNNGHSDS